jgi:inorganic pyrophosphatase/K(+)-stimulated pyrophosphate-energized sodium pump
VPRGGVHSSSKERLVYTMLIADLSSMTRQAPAWLLAPLGAVLALVMAFAFHRMILRRPEGEPEMVRIAAAVRQGAMAYLRRQYRVVAAVFIVLVAVLLVLGLFGMQELWTAAGVPVAGVFSGLCGWFGMRTATSASARTAFGAKQSLNDGLTVAFRAGAVMGLVVVGFALLDVSMWFLLWNTVLPERSIVDVTTIMLSYGMGASTQALFARVGGGIYTKAADVGADLVGKVEAGIPEDDPRNPATIADNVGDNVGDVAGMGADLYESYYGSILASMALGAASAHGMSDLSAGEQGALALKLAVAPMALAGVGILASIMAIFFVRTRDGASFAQLLNSLRFGVWTASGLIIAGAAALLAWLFRDVPEVSGWGVFGSIITGLIAGLVIAAATEYFTSYEHAPTRSIARQAQTGPATVIIGGTAAGMLSTWIPIVTVVAAILLAFRFAGGADHFLMGLYGVGIAAVGMLSTLGITLATDAYGPIADNAGGNAQMSGQPPHVRERTDMLDSLGNTTAATGKGFAIGSAALTALALLAAYISVVQASLNRQTAPEAAEAASIIARADLADSPGITLAAAYRGHGRFAVVNPFTEERFGGLMLADDELRDHFDEAHAPGDILVFRSVEYHEHEASYQAAIKFDHGDHTHTEIFHLLRADRATIRQVLTYYDVTVMNPRVLGGQFLGVMLVFVFCALTMSAVGRAAYRMMNECRRQFGIMREAFARAGLSAAEIADAARWPREAESGGKRYPDYAECVAISTAGAQREMIAPALLAIAVPIAAGLVLGVAGVMGLLAGGLTAGFAVAIFMANAGGAWDNAKKYIEKGHYGGKGSPAHKAGVVGDTVGDPFKDTSGPSLNILIKLIAIVSVVFAGLIVRYAPRVGDMMGF